MDVFKAGEREMSTINNIKRDKAFVLENGMLGLLKMPVPLYYFCRSDSDQFLHASRSSASKAVRI